MSPPARPHFSIVTPCLNAAATIEKSLDSVRSQGYADVEHIIIDGGSTDGTLELLARRSDVIVVSERDDGLSDALNKGIALARGELVGWLNADDWYLPGAFDAVLSAVADEPTAPWVTGQCVIVDGEGAEIRHAISRYKNFWLRHYTFGRYVTHNFLCCPATFVRLEAYREVGDYRIDQRYSMDYDMFLRVGRLGDPAIVLRNLATFAMVEGTKSMTGFETQFREHYQIAKAHSADHRASTVLNWGFSHAIIAAYRAMRVLRRSRRSTDPPAT